MARTANPGTTSSVVAAVALTKRRFVGFDGALAAAGAKARITSYNVCYTKLLRACRGFPLRRSMPQARA